MADFDADTVRLLHDSMSKFESEMRNRTEMGRAIAQRTMLITKSVVALLILVAGVVFFLIWDLTGDMKDIIDNMVDMYERFERMSADMNEMTVSVVSMGENVEEMPTMLLSMQGMNRNVGTMTADMGTMSGDMVTMEGKMVLMGNGVHEMANRFTHLNQTVHAMRHDVNQMSGPVKSMFPGWR